MKLAKTTTGRARRIAAVTLQPRAALVKELSVGASGDTRVLANHDIALRVLDSAIVLVAGDDEFILTPHDVATIPLASRTAIGTVPIWRDASSRPRVARAALAPRW